jgi:hypothetical protein
MVSVPSDLRSEQLGATDEHQANAKVPGSDNRAVNDGTRSKIATHRVNSYVHGVLVHPNRFTPDPSRHAGAASD